MSLRPAPVRRMSVRRNALIAASAAMIGLSACLDRMLEAPYVLATGLGEAKTISPWKGGFYVGGGSGVFEVAADGTARQVSSQPVDALTSLADGWAAIQGDQLCTTAGRCLTVPGARDLAGWYGRELRVLAGDRVLAVPLCRFDAPDADGCPKGEYREIIGGLTGARGIAYGEGRRWLVWTDRDLIAVIEPEPASAAISREVLWSGMTDPRAAGVDGKGRVFVVQGAEPALYRVEGGGGVLSARWMEGVTDLYAGIEQGRLGDKLYLSSSAGKVVFLQPG